MRSANPGRKICGTGANGISSNFEYKDSKIFCEITPSICLKKETSYYITSLDDDAEKFAQAVRGHWGIENSIHWVLDICFREDESRIRKDNAPENFAVLRHIALNMLKKEGSLKKSIKTKRLKAGWDNGYLAKVLAG